MYLATKRSYRREVQALTRAAVELSGTGLLQELSVNVVEGPDDYLYGEEKALLEVIEGRDPLPRLLPPYELGLFATDSAIGWEAGARPVSARGDSNPTAVNNVETLAVGGAHHGQRGRVVPIDGDRCVARHRRRHGRRRRRPSRRARGGDGHPVLRAARAVRRAAAGPPVQGRVLRRVERGASRRCVRHAAHLRRLRRAQGSGLGAAGFAVYDDSVNMAVVAHEFSRFLAIESCGQCPPCKQGSLAITADLEAICTGGAGDEVLGEIATRLRSVTDANRCFLGTEEQLVVSSILRLFPEDIAELLEGRDLADAIGAGAADQRHRCRRHGRVRPAPRRPTARLIRLDVDVRA